MRLPRSGRERQPRSGAYMHCISFAGLLQYCDQCPASVGSTAHARQPDRLAEGRGYRTAMANGVKAHYVASPTAADAAPRLLSSCLTTLVGSSWPGTAFAVL